MRSRLRTLVPAALLALVASACGILGDDTLTVTAVFDDVADLVERAHVRAGDVPIGTVADIRLNDDQLAEVTLEVEPGTGLPASPLALLQKTSLLGERYVELRPPEDGGSGALEDGAFIPVEHTQVVGDLEALVATSNDLLAFVAADSLAAAVETGAIAFGGRGGLLGQLVTDIEGFVGGYEAGKDDLTRLIDNLDGLLAPIAAEADVNAEGIAVLERATRALEQEDERLLDTLEDVRRLAGVSTRIMAEHRVESDNFFRRTRKILAQLVRIDGALQALLTWLPRHNLHVPNGAINEHAQVWLDFLVCGMQEQEDNVSAQCDKDDPTFIAPPPPIAPNPPECDADHSRCPIEGATSNDPRAGAS